MRHQLARGALDIGAYMADWHFHIRENGERLALGAQFDADATYHLHETPLAADQPLTPLDDGRVELTGTVQDTAELRWWLLGFGSGVEVIAPAASRGIPSEGRTLGGALRHGAPSPAAD